METNKVNQTQDQKLIEIPTLSKSIIIDANIHSEIKKLAQKRSLKLGGLVEDLIKLYINDPKGIMVQINELKEKNQEL